MSEEVNDNAKDVEKQLQALAAEKEAILSKNKELLAEMADLKALRKQLDELGGLDRVKQLEDERREQAQKALEASGNVDSIKEHYSNLLKQEQERASALTSQIVNSHIDTQLRSAVSKEKGSYALLEHQLKSRIKGEYVEGKVKVNILATDGSPMLLSDGREATFTDLVKEYKSAEEFSRAFEAPVSSGSGATNGSGVNFSNPDKMTLDEITKLYQKNPGAAQEALKQTSYRKAIR